DLHSMQPYPSCCGMNQADVSLLQVSEPYQAVPGSDGLYRKRGPFRQRPLFRHSYQIPWIDIYRLAVAAKPCQAADPVSNLPRRCGFINILNNTGKFKAGREISFGSGRVQSQTGKDIRKVKSAVVHGDPRISTQAFVCLNFLQFELLQ